MFRGAQCALTEMVIKRFSDGTYLEYAQGNFDSWCVYEVNEAQGMRRPPRDTHYFDFLLTNSAVYGVDKVYADFVQIYENTGKEVAQEVLKLITTISLGYPGKQLEFEKIFTIMYMGMIAEEQKAFTRLGKRIKRLGVFKLLKENVGVAAAANFMRGMRWQEIDKLCRERGF